MATTVVFSSTLPLTMTITTDQHMAEVKGNVTSGADVVPYDDIFTVHPVVINDTTGHSWNLASDDKKVPTSTVVYDY